MRATSLVSFRSVQNGCAALLTMLWIYFSFSCLLLLSIALAQPMNRGLPPLQNDNAINWDEFQPLNTGSDPYQTSQLSWNEVLQDREPSPRPNTETNTDKPRSPTHSIMGVDPGKEKKAPRKRRKQKWTTASLIAVRDVIFVEIPKRIY